MKRFELIFKLKSGRAREGAVGWLGGGGDSGGGGGGVVRGKVTPIVRRGGLCYTDLATDTHVFAYSETVDVKIQLLNFCCCCFVSF